MKEPQKLPFTDDKFSPKLCSDLIGTDLRNKSFENHPLQPRFTVLRCLKNRRYPVYRCCPQRRLCNSSNACRNRRKKVLESGCKKDLSNCSSISDSNLSEKVICISPKPYLNKSYANVKKCCGTQTYFSDVIENHTNSNLMEHSSSLCERCSQHSDVIDCDDFVKNRCNSHVKQFQIPKSESEDSGSRSPRNLHNSRNSSNSSFECEIEGENDNLSSVDEHFRKSLEQFYAKKSLNKHAIPHAVTRLSPPSSVSVSGAVDDHFLKSLGTEWLQIKNQNEKSCFRGEMDTVDEHFTKALGYTWLQLKANSDKFAVGVH